MSNRPQGAADLGGRLFVAAWPDIVFLDALDPADDWIERTRWLRKTPRAQRHITAAFLGDTSHASANAAITAIASITSKTSPINIHAGELVALPDRTRPRVIALEVATATGDLLALLRGIVAKLAGLLDHESLNRSAGRAPRPHITLARARRGQQCRRTDLQKTPHIDAAAIMTSLTLVRSTLTPDGPRYETLRSFALGEAPQRQRIIETSAHGGTTFAADSADAPDLDAG